MLFYKTILPILLAAGLMATSLAYSALDEREIEPNDANFNEHLQQLNQRDLAALRDFLHSKRNLDLLDKITHLSFAGDVRSGWRHTTEKLCGRQLRGTDFLDPDGIPYSRNAFNVEFNFIVEYETERTWAVAHLDYDNSAGIDQACCCCDDQARKDGCVTTCPRATPAIRDLCHRHCKKHKHQRMHGSGTEDDIDLKRCYFGYQFYKDHCSEIDVELGRRKMYDVFESDIQFNTRFDALVIEGGTTLENIGKIYAKAAGFVVDQRINHFAWGAEIGMLNIMDIGLDFKYSLVDWQRTGHDRCHFRISEAFRYLNSQVILTYHFKKEWLCHPAAVYAAGVWNHAARRQNSDALGWYAGFMIGEVDKEGDWALELEYQWVGPEAIAWDDQNGIGVGDILANFCGGPGPTYGYQGWQLDTLYALTDNITIDTTLQWATSVRDLKHSYSQLEIQAIYAF